MKRYAIIFLLVAVMVSVQSIYGQAKYVFYFIGDGMGVNSVNLAETYLSNMNGERGSVSLQMTQFPVATFATTFSASSDITDSAASGTALSTGKKTRNRRVGVDPNGEKLENISEKAKKAGKKVGIATTVAINHATPASFYAHQKSRNNLDGISNDLLNSGFDFFAGAGFTKVKNIYSLLEQAGYTVSKGYADFKANGGKSKKVVLVHEDWETPGDLPFAIDRGDSDLSLKQITEAAIEVLMRDNKKGFFLMLEGGRIDAAAHGRDGATTIKEVIDMDEAIKVAFEFYKKHPKETLIVVTADHDTGGVTVGTGSLNIEYLQYQQCSQNELTSRINKLRDENTGIVSWEEVKSLLSESMGFWKEVPINWEHEKILRDTYENTLALNRDEEDVNLYAVNSMLAAKSKEVLNEIAGLSWGTKSHTGGYVPVFVIGVGQELFTHKMDNTDIPKKIIKAAKY